MFHNNFRRELLHPSFVNVRIFYFFPFVCLASLNLSQLLLRPDSMNYSSGHGVILRFPPSYSLLLQHLLRMSSQNKQDQPGGNILPSEFEQPLRRKFKKCT